MKDSIPMIDDFAKDYLRGDLQDAREAVLGKLDGLSEYEVRRPLTFTGTNLLGLIKHLATWEARYLGEVFGRTFPDPLPHWNDATSAGTDLWATADETRDDIVTLYRRAWAHADATINVLDIGAEGRVPWWPQPNVKLFNVLVHLLSETNRHAGHADILREQLDGQVGTATDDLLGRGASFWAAHCQVVEQAARVASSRID